MAAAKVLVVDDDRDLVELIRTALETAGYEVVQAFDEDEALDKAREQGVDLSVVGLQLVQKDGISLMEDLHQVIPHMPVIILTAHGSIESAVEAMKKGAYSYLTKPFESRDLLFQIEKAIENSRLSTEVERLGASWKNGIVPPILWPGARRCGTCWRECPASPTPSPRSCSSGKAVREKT